MGFVNAGLDPIEQFVGGYHYEIQEVGTNLRFTITNRTTISSLIPHPSSFYIWPESWNPKIGPFSIFYQTYIFTEPKRK